MQIEKKFEYENSHLNLIENVFRCPRHMIEKKILPNSA
jgi:hypothetical protein